MSQSLIPQSDRSLLEVDMKNNIIPSKTFYIDFESKKILGMVDDKTKVKSKTFSSVKPDASAQNVYEVAEALMELQEYSTIEIAKIDNTTLA